jgi:acyl carrier protein
MSSESLNNFLVKQTSVDRDELIDETSLEGDLGVYGDDAVELIVAFGKEFHVDVSNYGCRLL